MIPGMTLNNNDTGKKKSIFRKILTMRESNVGRKGIKSSFDYSESEAQFDSELENLFTCGPHTPMPEDQYVKPYRVFVATWNVAGKPPHSGLNLDEFLQVHDESDIYVLGFQETVPLNAGNVLVIEDNEPAVNWLDLINQSLNTSPNVCLLNRRSYPSDNQLVSLKSTKSTSSTGSGSSLFFQKPSLRKYSKKFRTESKRRLKTCNCTSEFERKYNKDSCFRCQQTTISENDASSEEEDGPSGFAIEDASSPSSTNHMKYSLVVSKQMVGIFVTIWMRKELVQHVGHLRISCISRGIMGYLGNKGCISVSMTFHQTSFCFVCSHLASGEREGDELRRNYDVTEILKNTQFPKICKTAISWVPDKILEHDRVIWFGDLNYRIALSYSETRKLLERNDWDALLDKDQLKMERESGRVFKGWKEGKIYFAPTYKYSYNSDTYAGETMKSKNKRRTPAWCDRILWHGSGIRQHLYIRGESRFSDHRPVCSTFLVDVGITECGLKKV